MNEIEELKLKLKNVMLDCEALGDKIGEIEGVHQVPLPVPLELEISMRAVALELRNTALERVVERLRAKSLEVARLEAALVDVVPSQTVFAMLVGAFVVDAKLAGAWLARVERVVADFASILEAPSKDKGDDYGLMQIMFEYDVEAFVLCIMARGIVENEIELDAYVSEWLVDMFAEPSRAQVGRVVAELRSQINGKSEETIHATIAAISRCAP